MKINKKCWKSQGNILVIVPDENGERCNYGESAVAMPWFLGKLIWRRRSDFIFHGKGQENWSLEQGERERGEGWKEMSCSIPVLCYFWRGEERERELQLLMGSIRVWLKKDKYWTKKSRSWMLERTNKRTPLDPREHFVLTSLYVPPF